MHWLKRLRNKRKAKKQYFKCLKMYWKHEKIYGQTGSDFELHLMEYWRKQSEEAWKEYDAI